MVRNAFNLLDAFLNVFFSKKIETLFLGNFPKTQCFQKSNSSGQIFNEKINLLLLDQLSIKREFKRQ